MLSLIEYYVSKLIKKMHFKALKNSFVHKSSSVGAGSLLVNSQMGANSFCGYDCTINDTIIGKYCSIASNCEIGGASHSIDWGSTSPVFNANKDQISQKYSRHKFETSKVTVIGNDVWIGSRALIKSGVNIGNGAVIGMGSVVTKDIPPYEIWAGNPAKFIRKRFEDSIITRLNESKWWDLNDSELVKVAVYICDVEKFMEVIQELKGRK